MPFTLMHAHAMAMILSWVFFGPTGILFARYGRSLRLGHRRQLFGKAVWFQIHRFLLSASSLLTLLGFLFIFTYAKGTWVSPQIFDKRLFAHSIIGGIIVCCSIVQVWLALYRCHPQSRFRYIFGWSHRILGLLTFGLSIPNLFLRILMMSKYSTVLITLISFWAAWIVIIILVFEKTDYKRATPIVPVVANGNGSDRNQENNNTNSLQNIETATIPIISNRCLHKLKPLFLLIHIIVSVVLSISLIVFICS